MRKLVVNSECIASCLEYDYDVLATEAEFRTNSDTADIEDTLEIACPHPTCELRFELYLKDVRGERMVRNGVFGEICFLSTLDNRGEV